MSGQLYRGHANATALSSSPRVSAHRAVDFRLPHPILSAFKERNIADKKAREFGGKSGLVTSPTCQNHKIINCLLSLVKTRSWLFEPSHPSPQTLK